MALCGESPIDDESRAEYFDSLYHSAAVVGVTTSAFLEAAIVGRPVMTIFSEDLRHEHEGSLHFQHLLTVAGGLLTTARTLDEHEAQLADILDGRAEAILERQQRFVQAFIRPHGLAVSATGIAAGVVEQLAAVRASAPRRAHLLGRAGLLALTVVQRFPRGRRWLLSPREIEKAARQQETAHETADTLEPR